MPPGGNGFYYFSVYLTVRDLAFVRFDMDVNTETICTAFAESNDPSTTYPVHAACSVVAIVAEGKTTNY